MTTEAEALATVTAFVRAWERNIVDEILELFTEDAVWYDGYPADPYVGHDEIRAQLDRFSRHITDVHIEIVNQAVNGDVVLQERVDRGLRKGKPFEVAAACVFKVRDGKIAENRDYWNPGAYRAMAEAAAANASP
jgi:limonene-1,2-epoxide hydrolase